MAKERKNFFKEYKLFAACEKDDSTINGHLERVYFEHGNAYATDGHILIRVPLSYCTPFEDEQIQALNGFCVHGKILKLIYGFDVVTVERTLTTEDAYDNLLEAAEPVVYIKAVYQGEQVRFRLERSDKEFVANFERLLAAEEAGNPSTRSASTPACCPRSPRPSTCRASRWTSPSPTARSSSSPSWRKTRRPVRRQSSCPSRPRPFCPAWRRSLRRNSLTWGGKAWRESGRCGTFTQSVQTIMTRATAPIS